jgi:hypothetical protein
MCGSLADLTRSAYTKGTHRGLLLGYGQTVTSVVPYLGVKVKNLLVGVLRASASAAFWPSFGHLMAIPRSIVGCPVRCADVV